MKEFREWLKLAHADLDTAKYNFGGKRYSAAAFFAQQAAEKALKALYIKKFKRLKKVHDLVLLAKALELPGELVHACTELTPAYVYTRYPDVTPIEDIDEVALKLIDYAEEVVEWVKKRA